MIVWQAMLGTPMPNLEPWLIEAAEALSRQGYVVVLAHTPNIGWHGLVSMEPMRVASEDCVAGDVGHDGRITWRGAIPKSFDERNGG